jgi:hypothetical protein
LTTSCPGATALNPAHDQARKQQIPQQSGFCLGPNGHIVVCEQSHADQQTRQPSPQTVAALPSSWAPRLCIGDNGQIVLCPKDEL